ncbi:IclR family transcriptional regulator [Variovorax paradoxus]|jgi:DNA-binding IclR family transcriptional regulator|uniref:IclR family transcriptional regulator n=1 Tax=Variovorax paradoxus TaxID=34073 RepID=UPI0024805D9F|nr:IclR family transcriptional regulator [Variovorax paradoxus]WGT63125.1 IclR family transcriptional regulator [Variovorax paradoxus]
MVVKTAFRVIEIVELFAREKQPLALSEMARLLEMPVSSCLGLIRTLEEQGYMYETGRRQGYYPTGRLLAMAQIIAAHDPVLDRVRPALEELRDGARETVLFGKFRDPNTVVYLEVLSAPQSIRYSAESGETRPAYANSMGRALLSTLAPEARRKLLEATRLQPLTDATLTTAEAIEQELERSPARGWYGNLGESIPDLVGLAWPLRIGGEAYAISVAGPRYRLEPRIDDVAAMLRSACLAIEHKG